VAGLPKHGPRTARSSRGGGGELDDPGCHGAGAASKWTAAAGWTLTARCRTVTAVPPLVDAVSAECIFARRRYVINIAGVFLLVPISFSCPALDFRK